MNTVPIASITECPANSRVDQAGSITHQGYTVPVEELEQQMRQNRKFNALPSVARKPEAPWYRRFDKRSKP